MVPRNDQSQSSNTQLIVTPLLYNHISCEGTEGVRTEPAELNKNALRDCVQATKKVFPVNLSLRQKLLRVQKRHLPAIGDDYRALDIKTKKEKSSINKCHL